MLETAPSDSIIEIKNLSRRFGKHLALRDITLSIQPGLVYGLVGSNGAGKTTLIKHLLGLYRAQQGTVRVFGKDPTLDPVGVLSQIGFLSEDRDFPAWMRVSELLNYTSAFYPDWDWDYAIELLQSFQLNPEVAFAHLSRGGKAQVGLITAVAHRPKLLLLDEPSSGLDPLVRKDILNAIVKTVADEGRTVIFSSHLLDEIELMSDYLLMLHDGQLVVEGEIDDLKFRYHTILVRCPENFEAQDVALTWIAEPIGSDWKVVMEGELQQIQKLIDDFGGEIVDHRPATLQEIFAARANNWNLSESIFPQLSES